MMMLPRVALFFASAASSSRQKQQQQQQQQTCLLVLLPMPFITGKLSLPLSVAAVAAAIAAANYKTQTSGHKVRFSALAPPAASLVLHKYPK